MADSEWARNGGYDGNGAGKMGVSVYNKIITRPFAKAEAAAYEKCLFEVKYSFSKMLLPSAPKECTYLQLFIDTVRLHMR